MKPRQVADSGMWGCCRWSALKGVLVDAVTGILGVGSGRGERAGGLGELAETFVVSGPAGTAVRTRLKHLTTAGSSGTSA
jgi:hypothetical protein